MSVLDPRSIHVPDETLSQVDFDDLILCAPYNDMVTLKVGTKHSRRLSLVDDLS